MSFYCNLISSLLECLKYLNQGLISMGIKIGYLKSENQFLVTDFDKNSQALNKKTLDVVELKETALNLLLIDESLEEELFANLLEGEKKFYPILEAKTFGIDLDTFDSFRSADFIDLYTKVQSRWTLSNNIQTIEQIYGVINYMKNLWLNDRGSFFEELWFTIKTNLGTNALTIIFNDLKEAQNKEKDKPSLIHSFVTGEKLPNIFEGAEKEAELMKSYAQDFGNAFEVTEFDPTKGRLVATSQIGLSPILIMAELSSFTQLQKSLMVALFSGLQVE